MTCFAPLSEYDLRDCLCSGFLLRILRVSFMSASFGVLCFVRPSRCFVICMLRGALLRASFEVLCLCILRGAMFLERNVSLSVVILPWVCWVRYDWAARRYFGFGEKRPPLASVLSQGILFEGCFWQGRVSFGISLTAFSMIKVLREANCCRSGRRLLGLFSTLEKRLPPPFYQVVART